VRDKEEQQSQQDAIEDGKRRGKRQIHQMHPIEGNGIIMIAREIIACIS